MRFISMTQGVIAAIQGQMKQFSSTVITNPLSILAPEDRDSNTLLRVNSPSAEGLTPSQVQQLAGLFLVLGLLARLIRYYLCFPLWDDESFLCVNFINRSYAELLQPLDYHQVAPILFLWIERTSVVLFGYSEYALRLFPFICSIASLFLFRNVASRLLDGTAFVFAVALFAVSYPGIRYSAEAKPYCTDMFASLILLSLIVSWISSRDVRRLTQLTVLTPLLLGISYPTLFTAGGLSLVAGAVLMKGKASRQEWLRWFLWNVSIVASFAFWFLFLGKVQSGAEGEFMGEYWKSNFPPVTTPWMLPWWILKIHASDFLAYPLGGPNWASSVTLILCCAGLWRLISQRHFLWLGLLLAPASLHFVAAALQRYPYGGHVKFSQYLSAMICCLAAVGITQVLAWRSCWVPSRSGGLCWSCGILIGIGCVAIARDLANPYKTRSDYRARAFAQSFWIGTHSAEEVACLKSDWKIDFVPEQHHELSWSAHYLCNRAIEVSRFSLQPADLKKVSRKRPLRCVFYHDARYPLDQKKLDEWLAEMGKDYELISKDQLPFPRFAKDDRRLLTMEFVNSFRFVPWGESDNGLPSAANGLKPPPE